MGKIGEKHVQLISEVPNSPAHLTEKKYTQVRPKTADLNRRHKKNQLLSLTKDIQSQTYMRKKLQKDVNNLK